MPVSSGAPAMDDERKRHSGPTHGTRCMARRRGLRARHRWELKHRRCRNEAEPAVRLRLDRRCRLGRTTSSRAQSRRPRSTRFESFALAGTGPQARTAGGHLRGGNSIHGFIQHPENAETPVFTGGFVVPPRGFEAKTRASRRAKFGSGAWSLCRYGPLSTARLRVCVTDVLPTRPEWTTGAQS
jgi:hypothetical protein